MTLDGDDESQRSNWRSAALLLGVSTSLLALGASVAPLTVTGYEAEAAKRASAGADYATRLRSAPRGSIALRRILERNTRVVVIFASGVVTFGLSTSVAIPLASFATVRRTVVNAYALAIPERLLIAAILPHAVVELIGFAFAGAAGLNGALILAAAHSGSFSVARRRIWLSVSLVAVGLSLVAFAGLIEAYVTPFFIDRALRS